MTPDPAHDVEFSSERLDDRVLSTLDRLGGRIAFNGLRRVLRAHPESLSRALRRLEREGLIQREDGGYRSLARAPGPAAEGPLRSVAAVELGPGVLPDAVLGRLAGHWFGDLRWVGVVEGADGRLLAWARRDGAETVLLGVRERTLRVFVRDASAGTDVSDGEDAAYELLQHAVEALRPAPTRWEAGARMFERPSDGFPPAARDN